MTIGTNSEPALHGLANFVQGNVRALVKAGLLVDHVKQSASFGMSDEKDAALKASARHLPDFNF